MLITQQGARRILWVFAKAAIVLGVVFALFLSAGPYLVRTFVLPGLLKNSPVPGLSVDLQHLTPWRLAGNIELGGGASQAVSLPHIEIHYTPLSLLHGRLTSLLIDGATIRLQVADGKLSLKNVKIVSASGKGRTLTLTPLPLAIDSLSLSNCLVQIQYPGRSAIDLLLSGHIICQYADLPNGGFTLASADGALRTDGILKTSDRLTFRRGKKENHLQFTADVESLDRLALFSPGSFTISGRGQLLLAVDLSHNFKKIDNISASVNFPALSWEQGPIRIESAAKSPLQLNLNGDADLLHFTLTHFKTSGPHGIELFLQGEVAPFKATLSGSGMLQTKDLTNPVHLSLAGSSHERQADISLQLTGNSQKIITVPGEDIEVGPYRLTTRLHEDRGSPVIDQEVDIKRVDIPKQQVQLRDIGGRLHVLPHFSSKDHSRPGTLSIQKISYKGQDVAQLKTSITQTAKGIDFNGKISGLLGAKPSLVFHGSASPGLPLSLTYTLPPVEIDRDTLPASLPLPSGASLSGKIQAEGSFEVTKTLEKGRAAISLTGGSFDLPDKKISLSGIDCRISFPHLPDVESGPSQLLSIARMDINTLKFTEGKIYFRIENSDSLFVEKSRFNWCHGRIESGAFGVSTKKKGLSTTLYCDRLQFSDLLNQFGIQGTEGTGSLNGSLPIALTDNGLAFDDGFLFSTPGDVGTVRFNNSGILRQGLTGGSNMAVLDYSLQAMQNFSYNWTKLTFNSSNGTLLIRMQIDGKPAAPLPYGYKGGRLVAQKEGPGLQRQIRLDINFHLPFEQMFKYGRSLQKIMENIR